ncbi:MAG: response regulator [Phycisphaerales bacterium]|nr:response regulator [Phycisphaerales bacterium]
MLDTKEHSLLVVEDTFLIGMQLKQDLERLGYNVLGPAPSVSAALKLITNTTPGGAVLDVNLGREDSIPIARKLSELSVPFLFITGFENVSIKSDEFGSRPLIRKPVLFDTLKTALAKLMDA